ncbi:hypothetical protein BU26DRAFT_522313 [Trematosphaeria pertusa]|uniref:Aminoglycoside phosphotransferase domain-containing protein n=1 Tax=Trematosphaeria pertusa TaxID=390896 RepID=A0A6A6I4C5_9PLEO|nr:uncharacterized protein BU26DRAFT_522313 [Trematosphaeria pertusa]KAF2245211.1 hypothetical protein BU26DRAFT_522313 [Trematosphaeria pertusa]
MDWDERAELAHEALALRWFSKFREQKFRIADWVSSYRDGQSSTIISDYCGSFNWSCRLRFEDNVEWLIRFPVPGRVMDCDEKLRREVAVMCLVREKTKIPVPKVHAWGLSNNLGLGPFIIMDYIRDGESLGNLWREAPEKRTLRTDISERDLRIVFRQIAEFYLELSALEFPNIGSLSIRDDQSIHADLSPITLKMQEIEAHSGVKVRGHRLVPFSSAREYFYNVAEQDMEQLHEQPNSIDNEDDARAKYNFRHQFNAVLPRFVADDKYNQTSFRLICDDFRYGNMIVNNASDLKIIAVIDWEWAYTAPYQMFSSAPRWLLITKPILWEVPNGSQFQRYMACLELFLSELELEESRRTQDHRLSNLMRKSLSDGRFWFHELVYGCFTAADNPAWKAICEMLPDISNLASPPQPELDAFVEKKRKQLEVYTAERNAIKKDRVLARVE